MSEIEKAREALVEKLMVEGGGTREEAEDVVSYFAPFIKHILEYNIWFNLCLTPEQKAEHLRKQRESWVRGEMGLGLDNKRATEKGGEANSPGRHERSATGLDKSPPAVEAPAAGAMTLQKWAQRIRGIVRTESSMWRTLVNEALDEMENATPSPLGPKLEAAREAVAGMAGPEGAYTEEMVDRIVLAGADDWADMTALARRLAEALRYLVERCEYQPSGPEYAAALDAQGWKERKALSDSHTVLAEARKHKLIE